MKVNFYATLRQVVGERTIDFQLPEGATVRQLLDEMIRCYPALQNEMFDKQGSLYRHVHIFINSRDAIFLEDGLETPVPSDANIGIFPAVGGG